MTHKTNLDSKITIEKCDDIEMIHVARWCIFFDSEGESFEDAINNGIRELRQQEIYATVKKIEKEPRSPFESGPLRILMITVPVEVCELSEDMIDEEIDLDEW